MGYPMTFKRMVNRNHLGDGDYHEAPMAHLKRVITNGVEVTTLSEEETKLARFDPIAARCDRYEDQMRWLAGDLRRLERDAVDESFCDVIATRTGVDADIVAVVIKEFMAF